MRWLCLLLLVGCRTEPLSVNSDGGGPNPQPDLRKTEPQNCGGFAGLACPPNQFCEFPAGQCFNDSLGTCTPIPQNCTDIFDPVCGCDNVTYPNDCERQRAGVPLDYQGGCEVFVDLAIVDLTRVPDLTRPVDLGATDLADPCGASCGSTGYCYIGCCGTPNCTPPPPLCIAQQPGCTGCNCLASTGGCTCSEDSAGNVTYQCFFCP
jgi:hypothetical protein